MLLLENKPLHLTYCLNVHPGELWPENLEAIRTHGCAIRDRVAAGKPFGLGLRLSRRAADALSQPEALAGFRDFMKANALYAFTINGFPYGNFHGKPVKTEVYRPDWSTRERLDYTVDLARILAGLLPEGTEGSISTLPLGYGRSPGLLSRTADILNLADCAVALHALHNETGREIHIGLEPEPDCLLETTADVLHFFDGPLLETGVPRVASRLCCDRRTAETILRRHIGVCFDTCHLAIQFENLADSLTRLTRQGIRISKVQLSAALEARPGEPTLRRLNDFLDPVYLHQVKVLQVPSGRCQSYPDLSDALKGGPSSGLWRIHFHLPLYYPGDGLLNSTTTAMGAEFWQVLKSAPVSHWEIETYTFHVLPPAMQAGGIDSSIMREYDWVQKHAFAG